MFAKRCEEVVGKSVYLAVLAAFLLSAGRLFAGSDYSTHSLGPLGVSVTNDQRNAQWSLASVLIRFSHSPTGSVDIVRVSGGVPYLLGSVPGGSTSVVWWAEQPVVFRTGDSVTVTSGGGTGTVQVIKRSEAQ